MLKKITNLMAVPGIIYVGFTLPLVILKALIPHSILDVGNGGWGFLYYLWFLIAGFILLSNDRLQLIIKQQRWISLVLGVALSTLYLYLLFGVSHPFFQGQTGDWISSLLNFFSSWCWLFAILGFAMKNLAFDRPQLRYLNEGVLPFFILHQTVLLGFGYFVMNWDIQAVLKWGIVFASSFIFIVALYIVLIRRFDLFRFLFGMKTSSPAYLVFREKGFLILLPAIWLGLTVFAGINQTDVTAQKQFPAPITHPHGQDIVLNASSITRHSPTGMQVIPDKEASIGQAIRFISGEMPKVQSQPKSYVDFDFTAPAGRYFVWIRGKSNTDSELTDSIWMQVDNQIGTSQGSVHLGNWNSFHPAGVYAWASDVFVPLVTQLKHTGKHTIRIQPRQVPHRIDQIWLSPSQSQIPDTRQPVR